MCACGQSGTKEVWTSAQAQAEFERQQAVKAQTEAASAANAIANASTGR